jgi:dTDP-4-amino-4,6-dideoxygalactose transaminase
MKYDNAFAAFRNCRPAQLMGRDLSGHHLYVLRINFKALGKSRVRLMKELKAKGIGSQVHYIPVPMQPYYQKQGFSLADYPNAIKYYEEALSIPLFYDLENSQQEHIIAVFKDLVG